MGIFHSITSQKENHAAPDRQLANFQQVALLHRSRLFIFLHSKTLQNGHQTKSKQRLLHFVFQTADLQLEEQQPDFFKVTIP